MHAGEDRMKWCNCVEADPQPIAIGSGNRVCTKCHRWYTLGPTTLAELDSLRIYFANEPGPGPQEVE